jgi:putative holliday junction resolvase
MARVGLAISDVNKIISQPLLAVKVGKNPTETAQLIAKELARYDQLEAIVMGLPLLLSGKDGDMAKLVREFKIVLEQVLNLPVFLWDERLTSQQVERLLKSADLNRKARSQVSDAVAAATILQSYLAAQ